MHSSAEAVPCRALSEVLELASSRQSFLRSFDPTFYARSPDSEQLSIVVD